MKTGCFYQKETVRLILTSGALWEICLHSMLTIYKAGDWKVNFNLDLRSNFKKLLISNNGNIISFVGKLLFFSGCPNLYYLQQHS